MRSSAIQFSIFLLLWSCLVLDYLPDAVLWNKRYLYSIGWVVDVEDGLGTVDVSKVAYNENPLVDLIVLPIRAKRGSYTDPLPAPSLELEDRMNRNGMQNVL